MCHRDTAIFNKIIVIAYQEQKPVQQSKFESLTASKVAASSISKLFRGKQRTQGFPGRQLIRSPARVDSEFARRVHHVSVTPDPLFSPTDIAIKGILNRKSGTKAFDS